MKKGNVFILAILLYSFLFMIMSCKKESYSNRTISFGHLLIYHEGEQNKPVPSFLIKTFGDTTYQRITRHSNGKDLNHPEFNKLDIWNKDMEDCNVIVYSKFKEVIIEYCKNNEIKPNYEYGTFKVDLMDSVDSLTFTMYRSDYTASFFDKLLQIAQENNLQKAANRFKKYKNMQPQ